MEVKVSVIIPVYNRIESLRNAITSVLGQTYKNFELIIVDDCSTLNIKEVVNAFNDPRIIFLQLKSNSGAAAARNYGVKHSKTPFISFLDSDDTYEPTFLEISFNHISRTSQDVGFMWTGVRIHTEKNKREYIWKPKEFDNPYITFLQDLRIGTGAGITLRREVFDNCGLFREDLPAAEDTEFFLRISKCYSYTFNENILINIYREDSDRMSINFKNLALSYNIFVVEHFQEIEKDNQMKIKFFYKLMWLNYNLPDKNKARFFYRKIPKRKLSIIIKSLFTIIIYEFLPLKVATKVHLKLAL